MGYGKNFKEILDNKDLKVIDVARECGISPTTLYSAIQRDSAVRYDYALKIAEAYEIDPRDICSTVPADYRLKTPQLDFIIESFDKMDTLQRERLLKYIEKLLKSKS